MIEQNMIKWSMRGEAEKILEGEEDDHDHQTK